MAKTFDEMASDLGYHTDVLTMMPKVLAAGDDAGALTPEGAAFLDESGQLISGIPLAPPEGDAGTGMTATNSVRPGTGNVSAGTSDFSMIVLEQPIGVHVEIDIVNTPDGSPAAMIHCNNCTSDINAWVALFGEFANLIGAKIDTGTLFTKLFESALSGDPDCGGLLSYNYLSGEGVTAIDAGRPLFLRDPDAAFNLPNFMRMHLMSAMATLTIGMDILTKEEHVPIKTLYGHGGFFKTPQVGARILSAAVNAPIQTMTTAGEGGAYGIALLAAYEIWHEENETLPDYLETKVFADAQSESVMASEEEVAGFARFLKRYLAFFEAERIAALTQG